MGRSAGALRLCRPQQCCSLWVYQQRCISTSQNCPKGTGRVGERRYTLCQAWFLSLDSSQRFSRAHILTANLCRSPYHHTFAMSLHCSSKSGTADVHQALDFGAGCVPDTLGLQDDTDLLTTSSMFTQEQRNGVTSV